MIKALCHIHDTGLFFNHVQNIGVPDRYIVNDVAGNV